MSSVNGYGVQKGGQEESKIHKDIETVEVERVGGERRVFSRGYGHEDWYGLKRNLLDVVSEVCGYTKGKPRHFEGLWWNKDVDVAVFRKRELFKIWEQYWNDKDRKKYCEEKVDAKRVVSIYSYETESSGGSGEG